MKKNILFTFLAFFLLTNIHSQTFKLSTSNSKAKWTGYSEVGGYEQSGSINLNSGELTIDNDKITSARLSFDTKSISHTDKKLEKHLKAKDFFYVKKYPESIFILKKLKDGKAFGELTMRGKTNPITIPIKIENEKIRIIGNVVIDRTKFEIKYNSSSYFQDLGSYAIKNEFDLSFDVSFISNN